MHHSPLPSFDRMYDLLRPNFACGELFWRSQRGRQKTGDAAGFPNDRGYFYIGIDGERYLFHRVMYAMYHKVDPGELEVDHIDGDKADSRVANLRLTTRAQNGQNISGYRQGLKGAYRTSRGGKPWMSTIQTNGVRTYLGAFDTEIEAHEAYKEASTRYHGEFGRPH